MPTTAHPAHRGKTATDGPTGPPWWLSATFLAVVLAAVRVAMVAVLPYDRAVGLFDDDAFYYFGIARHIADGDGSTFNGLDPTNGYHPLWLAVLTPVFAVADGRAALVCVTVVSAVLFLASARLLDRIGRLTGRPVLATACAAPLLLLGAAGPTFWFSGMETGLLLTATLAVAWLFARTDGLRDTGPRQAVLLGVLVTLTVLARLDAVFPMAVLGVLATVTWMRQRCRRLIAWAAAVPAVVIGTYLAVETSVFGTAFPVSGQAKALGASGVNVEVLGQFATDPVVFGVPTLAGLIAIAVMLAARLGAQGRPDPAATFGAVVLAGGALTVGYYALTSSWQLWPWYFSAAPLAIALSGPAALHRLPESVGRDRVLAAVACVAALAVVAVTAVRTASGPIARSAFVADGPAVAAELETVARGESADVAVAMGDRAGSVGYHLHRPLVQLEGLVNSREYLDALLAGTVPAFLAERRVGLYVRGDTEPGRAAPDFGPECRRFFEPAHGTGPKVPIVVCDPDLVLRHPLLDGTEYRAWRYRVELNR
ncbi:4-amino-4-deoxy-L-arabinose transferase-like glycosyltransferase [Herbihabitans rhizosphaerae]|uniref:4-amino-4-deoxy-L-arabinose transferase-like glycosyltransferase n=1 Tax=Herbihabitans rhizosphaerae TaxID=1872711 RepID=A0A4Q7KW55_9PSEU|nr:hypothetical protein [Herbihabitans rhizosphaerae]RZS40905.1 4-amino-4-deoxy-L-arabinose transferase-like glycosyltransferase [Herbihabitans rhizosphaerae]